MNYSQRIWFKSTKSMISSHFLNEKTNRLNFRSFKTRNFESFLCCLIKIWKIFSRRLSHRRNRFRNDQISSSTKTLSSTNTLSTIKTLRLMITLSLTIKTLTLMMTLLKISTLSKSKILLLKMTRLNKMTLLKNKTLSMKMTRLTKMTLLKNKTRFARFARQSNECLRLSRIRRVMKKWSAETWLKRTLRSECIILVFVNQLHQLNYLWWAS
jgi:hypothetical protein